tara:strand:- start:590 stop:1060 length:471 start_codon:yes stop_codon:yes gene_type:complete
MATHASRDTTTGKINETNIEDFLIENYNGDVHSQVEVGIQFGTKKKHILDILLDGEVLKKKGRKRPISLHKGGTLVSLKYQKVEGTAEEKIPFECDKLQDAIDTYGYESAIIVLCGNDGWTLKEHYLSDKFTNKLKITAKDVTIMSEEHFLEEYIK